MASASHRQGRKADPALVSPLGERMLEEETQHFPRCIRSVRIGVGAGGAASRPCVSGSVDFPVLQASAGIGMDGAGVVMSSRYPSSMHPLFRARAADGLPDDSIAIVRTHRGVAIAVEDNRRDGRAVARHCLGPAALPHGEQRGGKVRGGPAGQSGMYADRRVQIAVGGSHNGGPRPRPTVRRRRRAVDRPHDRA